MQIARNRQAAYFSLLMMAVSLLHQFVGKGLDLAFRLGADKAVHRLALVEANRWRIFRETPPSDTIGGRREVESLTEDMQPERSRGAGRQSVERTGKKSRR